MVIDNQGRQFGGMGYDSMYSNHMQQPHFSDPWTSHAGHSSSHYSSLPKQESARPTSMSMQYPQIPVSAPMSSDVPRSSYEQTYSSPTVTAGYTASAYPALNYSQSLHQQQHQQQRKQSDSNESSRAANANFSELDASRGMLALSHQNLTDLTPRNIFDVRAQRGSTDSYGFPSTSSTSSISAASGRQEYPYTYAGSSAPSVDSATDYSSAASEAGYDSMTASRTLPRPSQLVGANLGPPAPQSMMGQFSSKMSSNTQKKHKCKVCDKRFTRPSSLQTHMYSHTGEKPFACNVEGCGRHFSVVSNLRRHRKVHKGESVSSHSDDEE